MDSKPIDFALVRQGSSPRRGSVVARCYLPDELHPMGMRDYRFDIDLRYEATRAQAARQIVETVPGLADRYDEIHKAIYTMSIGYEVVGPLDVSEYVKAAKILDTPPPPEGFEIISVTDLVREQPRLKPVVIEGLLRRGEIMNIVAAPKTGKSWAVHDLAMAIATGSTWFNFPCKTGRVLLIDNELHPQTLSMRLRRVAEERGLSLDSLSDRLDIVPMRGDLKDIFSLSPLFEYIHETLYSLIIVDSLYRALPQGVDENSNVDITRLYNFLDQVAGFTHAAIAIVHHTSKGTQAGKSITDVGAGAGAQARAADTHLTLRPHNEEGVVVLDAVVRSFVPVQPSCWRLELPRFKPEPDLSPSDLLYSRRRRRESGDPHPQAEPIAAPVIWTPEMFAEMILTDTPQIMDSISMASKAHGLSEREGKRLLNLAILKGLASKTGGTGREPARYFLQGKISCS